MKDVAERPEEAADASPESALGAIEARLARLDAFTRRVLRAGSVFGVRFPTAGLFALLGGETRRADIEDALRRADHERFVARAESGPGEVSDARVLDLLVRLLSATSEALPLLALEGERLLEAARTAPCVALSWLTPGQHASSEAAGA